ncbi:phosphoenolpyruvate--protein phosphotransferase [Jonesia denitrificans]|uniref:Phosphoenolpyruvate-protein phosphotransferase n=1 Tax=Jonesia denitrificans (strain ATCC 14870 / DSM 20603 / BCRC 15368 / CIP 55.134 / JCM 11481 / NBRC 15587 / NCTC 10816 / Prevot 55134) TaxID=471856 RepID=C7R2X1_JONDD|nr:phosphoenolpyruvate--protein phosphotransferase [Jonesia denitrificans]ACV08593.1 phosphoenolpyruvate-protein phosphotransferase [Jonesia denitrificans DSM 20603]ASE07784.1 phosphoenolpyruvate--protein phosphotransferase [Jonesia denitrificans]SQH20581.1 Phosphoenolpyruvate-protein phosphotransferase [Jonesia denitrificans]
MAEEVSATVAGIGVCSGVVHGRVYHLTGPVIEPAPGVRLSPHDDHDAQAARIAQAAQDVHGELEDAARRSQVSSTRDMLEATALLAVDPTLLDSARERVLHDHLQPERAVWEAAGKVCEQFRELGGYFAERTSDIADVRDRIIAKLTGRLAPGLPLVDTPYVLVAPDIPPSVAATLDEDMVLAIVTDGAGPTSHAAIIANAKGIPAVVAAHGATDALPPGAWVLVNGSAGTVVLDPAPHLLTQAKGQTESRRVFHGGGATKDGHTVELLANIGDPAGAREAVAAGAKGVGLFRTEFCFLDRRTPPSLEEQVDHYSLVFTAFAGCKVVIRTLDSGADKPLPFMTFGSEENPALGVRGFRSVREAPELLDTQLQAIATAAQSCSADVWVMAPMIATVDETQEFIDACHRHGLSQAGIMMETPSSALMAEHLMAIAEFASIGTNDLTQYALAADRMLGSLAELNDPWQPAVLRLVDTAVKGARAQGRPVGVCGEAAAQPALALVLVGLGVTSLSMSARSLADVSSALGAVDMARCEQVARAALAASSAAEARARVRELVPELTGLAL